MNRRTLTGHSSWTASDAILPFGGIAPKKIALAGAPLHFSDLPVGRGTPLDEIFLTKNGLQVGGSDDHTDQAKHNQEFTPLGG